jgi:hypothetical protein
LSSIVYGALLATWISIVRAEIVLPSDNRTPIIEAMVVLRICAFISNLPSLFYSNQSRFGGCIAAEFGYSLCEA